MCLVGLRLRTHPGHALVLAANRDEFHARPAAAAAFWDDAPHVLAGRDLEAGGTWPGVTRRGRWATVTNFRHPDERRAGTPSRGNLVRDFLVGETAPSEFAERVLSEASRYNALNLLVGEGDEVFYVSSRESHARRLAPGDYGLSNHALDTPWPKVRRLKEGLAGLGPGEPSADALLALLADRTGAPDHELPDTGVGVELERVLAPAFLEGPVYGTRASSVLVLSDDGRITFVERGFGPFGAELETRRFELRREIPA